MKKEKTSNKMRAPSVPPEGQKIILWDIDYTLFDTASYKQSDRTVYPPYKEVPEILSKLTTVVSHGIFSQGEAAHQLNKLEKSGIKKHFAPEHIHIVNTKSIEDINAVLKRYDKKTQVFLVDDKLPVLQLAKGAHPQIVAVWVKRGVYALTQKPIKNFSPDASIENLEEIIPIIESK